MKLISGNGHNRDSRHAQPAKRRSEQAQAPADNTAPARKPPKKKGGGWLIALLVIILLLLAALVYWKLFSKPVNNDDAPNLSGEDVEDYEEERYYTLLVVGDDQEGGNTDTIMLLRLDTVSMKVNVVSIPRDTLVNSPLGNKKINAIYHNLDGVESLMDEVKDVTGFRPNNYVVVNTDVFVEVVDAMGGVDFYVPFDMNYDDYHDYESDGIIDYVFTIHVNEGQQTLSGYDALGVFRWRQNNNYEGHVYANPDIERIDMQHKLLMAIAEKAMSTHDISVLYNIASAVLPKCETDLTMANIAWYATKFLQMSMDNIEFFTMPTTGGMVYKTSYVTVNVDDWLEMVNNYLNPYDRMVTREDCDLVYYTAAPTVVSGMYYLDADSFVSTKGEPVENNFNRR